MSRWISRECNMADPKGNAFREAGYTDFRDMVQGSGEGCVHGALTFTASQCGRFLMVSHGQFVYVYEMNHVCAQRRSRWSIPAQTRQGAPPGLLRPVTRIICPRRVIACSMDTSAGRYAAAFLMQGRVGMVCDISADAVAAPSPFPDMLRTSGLGLATPDLPQGSCTCQGVSPCWPPPMEEGRRTVYRNICHADDPPRSVAVCPQRNCVAFGCSAGIELH